MVVGLSAGLSLSFFTLPLWVAGQIAFAREVNRSDWLGFIGALIGASATLVASGIALFAAYKTLSPIKAQLSQLMKQNDFILFERLSSRATTLNDEEILVQKVAANCAVVSRALSSFEGDKPPSSDVRTNAAATAALSVAVERLTGSVEEIQKQRGEVWGNAATQALRRNFTNLALAAGSQAINMLGQAEKLQIFTHAILRVEIELWKERADAIHRLGAQLYQLGQSESEKIGRAIAEVEDRLF